MSRILLLEANVSRRHVVFLFLFYLIINITSTLATNDNVAEKELGFVLDSSHGSQPDTDNNSQIKNITDGQNNVKKLGFIVDRSNNEKSLLLTDTNTSTSKNDIVGEETTDRDIQVVTEVWEEDTNINNSITKKPHNDVTTSKHNNTSKDDGQDALGDEEGRNEEETIGQEVGGGAGAGGGGWSEEEGKGKLEKSKEVVLINEVGESKEKGNSTQEVQSNEGKEEREGGEEEKAHEKRGVGGGGNAGEEEKEKNKQRPETHDGGETSRAASGANTGDVGAGGNIGKKKGVVEEGGKRKGKEWIGEYVAGVVLDILVIT